MNPSLTTSQSSVVLLLVYCNYQKGSIMFPGETVATGAPTTIPGATIKGPKVMRSAAGYYIGYSYNEGYGEEPYTRESMKYWATEAQAQDALDSDDWTRRGYVGF